MDRPVHADISEHQVSPVHNWQDPGPRRDWNKGGFRTRLKFAGLSDEAVIDECDGKRSGTDTHHLSKFNG
jgi:hypothetical protein